MADLAWKNAKGFVLKLEDGGRWKVEFNAYLLAHRAASHLSVGNLFAAFQGGCSVKMVQLPICCQFMHHD